MYHFFGDRAKFALAYELMENPYGEAGLYGLSWGTLELWSNGMDLCRYEYDGKTYGFVWNLYAVIDWLLDHLDYLIGYDPHPLVVGGAGLDSSQAT